MQGKTIAHIGDVVSFMQQLHVVYTDYGSCVPSLEAVEETLTQNLGIQTSQFTLERAKQKVPVGFVTEKHLMFRRQNKLRTMVAAERSPSADLVFGRPGVAMGPCFVWQRF